MQQALRFVAPAGATRGERFGTRSLTDAARLALEMDLRRATSGEVRFDPASRGLYATDGSNYRQVPIGVVIPRTVEDITETVRLCRAPGVPLLGRGGRTSPPG